MGVSVFRGPPKLVRSLVEHIIKVRGISLRLFWGNLGYIKLEEGIMWVFLTSALQYFALQPHSKITEMHL